MSMDPEPDFSPSMLLIAVAFEGALGIVAVALARLLGMPLWQTLHWRPDDVLWGLAASLPMAVFFVGSLRIPIGPFLRIRHFAETVLRPMFACCSLADLAGIALMAGVGEEFLFRGLVQGGLQAWLPPLAALVLASLLFGLMHPITPTYVVLATLLGAGLGWLCWATDNLLTPIVAHAAYDFLALAYLMRTRPSPEPADGQSPGSEGEELQRSR